jgi:ATP-dependent Lhr-like helicase
VAARALLLPRRRPGQRSALWQQRKRASDLLAVAARFGSFPALLETYRECLRDQFDVPALVDLLGRVASRSIRMVTVNTEAPSPFASSLLFAYTANFIYDGDAPLAERRAQALLVDQSQLKDLLGDIELRELLDPAVIDEVEQQLQRLEPRYRARSRDGLHDMLLRLGDLDRDEIRRRSDTGAVARSIADLVAERRAIEVPVAGSARFVAVEDAARYRDALGAPLPLGLPESLLEPLTDPVGDLVLRYARTHGPFVAEAVAARFGLAPRAVIAALARLASRGRLVQGAFTPGRTGREWCEAEVLRTIRQRSLARLRREVEPVNAAALGRLAVTWHGVGVRRSGLDALLDVIEQLQGAPLPASLLERDILPARIDGYRPGDLDVLATAGEVAWVGLEPLGERDGRIAVYLADHLGKLLPPAASASDLDERAARIVEHLRREGASFFAALHQAAGGGYPRDSVDVLWDLAWQGIVTNDSFHALRAFTQPPPKRSRREARMQPFRSRRLTPATAEGRWSLVEVRASGRSSPTEWAAGLASQLLARHGIVTREAVAVENLPGGFSAVYEVLKAMEDAGRVRRGYFVGGLGATQFAQPAALDLLRSVRDEPEVPQTVYLAATDPANPYGAILKWPNARADVGRMGSWPTSRSAAEGKAEALPHAQAAASSHTSARDLGRGPTRSVGAGVIIVNGALAAYVGRADRQFLVFLPEDEPSRSVTAREVARMLHHLATGGSDRDGMLIAEIDGIAAAAHPLAPFLLEAGFVRRPGGFQAAPPRG